MAGLGRPDEVVIVDGVIACVGCGQHYPAHKGEALIGPRRPYASTISIIPQLATAHRTALKLGLIQGIHGGDSSRLVGLVTAVRKSLNSQG